MALHPLIPDYVLPVCLQKPLVIGDLDQIKALKTIKKEIEEKTARNALIESGELKGFEVNVQYEGEYTTTIYACDATEARKEAIEVADIDNCDYQDINIGYVTEIKP